MTIFLDLAVVLVAARAVGGLFRRFRQPSVVGEIIAGLLLGTILGVLPADLAGQLLPPEARSVLKLIGQVGLVLFAFLVGLDLDIRRAGKKRTVLVISLSSVLVPFALGVLLANGLYDGPYGPGHAGPEFLPFALFIGTAMAITAFPVLARILVDRGMHQTRIGALALACAALNDILGWSILAAVLAIVAAEGPWDLPVTLLESLAFAGVLVAVVRPLILRPLVARFGRLGRLDPQTLGAMLAGVAMCAWITELIGVHVVFGAFLLGAVWPRPSSKQFVTEVHRRLEPATLVLLPVFFVLPGLSINLWAFDSRALRDLGLVLFVATAGKFLSTVAASRWAGMEWREATALGTLMNTRGVMELVVLNIGLTAGIIDTRLYSVFVIMAVVTTLATEPVLRLLYPPSRAVRDSAPPRRLVAAQRHGALPVAPERAKASARPTRLT